MNRTSYRKPPFSLDRTRHRDLTEQLVSSLRTAILTGYYRAGDFLPPVRDLAVEVGVSPGIAARALSRIREEGLISPRPRIGSVVCEKNRPLWKGHVVIVVPPGLGNPFENFVYAVVRDRLTAAGYLTTPVSVGETSPGKFDDFALLDTVLRQQTDLVVLIQSWPNVTRWLSRRGTPYVRLAYDEFSSPNGVGQVFLRTDAAVASFVAHCAEKKVDSVTQVAVKDRFNISAALESAGVRVTNLRVPNSLYSASGFDISTWAANTFSRLLAAKGRAWLPDLIFFHDDHLATGALFAIYDAGLRVPDDVRVVTWANKNYGPAFVKPLTRIEMDNAAIGEKLAESVLEYLRDGKFPENVVVGPKYIRGETF